MGSGSEGKTKDQIPLFDGVDFTDWKRRLGNYLIVKDYDLVVGFDCRTFKANSTLQLYRMIRLQNIDG